MSDSPTPRESFDTNRDPLAGPVAIPTPRPRMSGVERRQVILAAARREFARAGYHGASTARIAQAADCSEPMLYKHFAGKQALFAETLADVYTVIEARFDGLFSQEGDLFENLDRQLPTIMADEDYAEMMQLRKLAITLVHEPAVHDALVDIEHRHMKRISGAVGRAIAEGTARPDLEPDYVAWMWTGIVLAACQREAMEPRGFVRMLPHAQTFLRGLRA